MSQVDPPEEIRVHVENLQNALPVDQDRVIRLVRFVLEKEQRFGEISVCFVDDEAIARLHGEYLGDPTPTDVITFPLSEEDSRPLDGEIVISSGAAIRQAQEHLSTPLTELHLYVVHGLLHLTGFDDLTEADAQKMEAAQEAYLGAWIALYGPFTD
ncbi:rRNA maturation RNase YbeY [bacterium TMED181]|nr:rRNA maturation RNase YbeY [Planctomycetota bacterium]OUW43166.1 MAG: rRNA maturation RNase YbeY [bacterium TMED181]